MIVPQLHSRIPLIMAQLEPSVKNALKEGAEAIAEDARGRVPVESGDLRDAIHVEEVEGGFSVVAGDEDVFYGHLVELGTTHTAPRPFLLPAGEARWDDVRETVTEALEDL